MSDDRDPIAAAADRETDLYDVATWEVRSRLDRVAVVLADWLGRLGRGAIVALALFILLGQIVLSGLATISDPLVGVFIFISILPAVLLVAFLWSADVTEREPLSTLLVTFVLGVLFASFAAVLNSLADPLFAAVPYVGIIAFYFLIVAPVEETVKLLAVRLYAFRRPVFTAVIDGAVYGAVAGLGFATIENTVYIGQGYLTASQAGAGTLVATIQTAAVRTLAGPGHVIYSAFAGYYLGLAKFNRANAGPIVVKGLLIGTLAHAGYNSLVGVVPEIVSQATGIAWPIAFLGFVLFYDGVLGYVLYRKIARYRRLYGETAAPVERLRKTTQQRTLEESHSEYLRAGAADTDGDAESGEEAQPEQSQSDRFESS